MLPILDRDVKRVPSSIEVIDDGLAMPVAITVHDVASIPIAEQFRIEVCVHRPGLGMWTDTYRLRSRVIPLRMVTHSR